jgi:hypothetical protein
MVVRQQQSNRLRGRRRRHLSGFKAITDTS